MAEISRWMGEKKMNSSRRPVRKQVWITLASRSMSPLGSKIQTDFPVLMSYSTRFSAKRVLPVRVAPKTPMWPGLNDSGMRILTLRASFLRTSRRYMPSPATNSGVRPKSLKAHLRPVEFPAR